MKMVQELKESEQCKEYAVTLNSPKHFKRIVFNNFEDAIECMREYQEFTHKFCFTIWTISLYVDGQLYKQVTNL